MRAIRISLGLAVLAAAAGGCSNHYGNAPMQDDRGSYNQWAIESSNDGAVRNAIIAQHTLYPYHFVEFSGQLNELGARDVQVLARHYARYPGELSLRRGSEPDQVYQQRIKSVTDALAAGGVAPGSIKIGDRLPGGDGADSSRVILIMNRADQPSNTTTTGQKPTAMTTGATANNSGGSK